MRLGQYGGPDGLGRRYGRRARDGLSDHLDFGRSGDRKRHENDGLQGQDLPTARLMARHETADEEDEEGLADDRAPPLRLDFTQAVTPWEKLWW